MFKEGQYITIDNVNYDNSLAPLINSQWALFGASSDIIMRNMDLNLKVRATRFSALASTGTLYNILVEDCNFYSAVGVGGTEPALTVNEDGTSYDMNILIQRNYMEGGTHYWGLDGANPNLATIDISGSGITVINNVIEMSQYIAPLILRIAIPIRKRL